MFHSNGFTVNSNNIICKWFIWLDDPRSSCHPKESNKLAVKLFVISNMLQIYMFQICYFLLLWIKFLQSWVHPRTCWNQPWENLRRRSTLSAPENFNYAPADDSQSRRKEWGIGKYFTEQQAWNYSRIDRPETEDAPRRSSENGCSFIS